MNQAKIVFGTTLLTLKTRYKNFKCDAHNKFFEVNLYQKNPINKHHWRANIPDLLEKLTCKETVRGGVEQQRAPAGSSGAPDLLGVRTVNNEVYPIYWRNPHFLA